MVCSLPRTASSPFSEPSRSKRYLSQLRTRPPHYEGALFSDRPTGLLTYSGNAGGTIRRIGHEIVDDALFRLGLIGCLLYLSRTVLLETEPMARIGCRLNMLPNDAKDLRICLSPELWYNSPRSARQIRHSRAVALLR